MRGATNAMQRMWRVQQMQTGGATNVKRGVQQMRWGATNVAVQRMRHDKHDYGSNRCSIRGAQIVPGARCAGDSNTKWRHQGVLGRAHSLLEIVRGSTKQAK